MKLEWTWGRGLTDDLGTIIARILALLFRAWNEFLVKTLLQYCLEIRIISSLAPPELNSEIRSQYFELREVELTSIVESVVAISQGLHGSGTFSEVTLRALARYAFERPIKCSAETGSGASTLLLSHASDRHLAFTIDSGSGSLENVKSSPLFRSETVTVIEGPTQITLPRYQFSQPIQFALIDGPHGYPFPDLEYFYLYPHLECGGILIVDDIQIPTIHNMFDVLSADDMWRLDDVVENTAFFMRTDAPTFPPTGDGWWLQKYNVGK